MDDLLADFVAETREMMSALGGELVAWEADPADRARLDGIFRFFHTVKGNCGFFDFPRLERLSHAAEDALAEVRDGRRRADRGLVSAILAVTDRIADMIDAIEAGEIYHGPADDALIAALASMADDIADSPTTGPAGRQSATGVQRSVRLPVDLLDTVMSGVADLVLARGDLARRLRAGAADPATQGAFDRLSTLLDGVRESVTRMRMQRIEGLFGALPRLVRDVSAELGKQVMIDLEGGDVELDREMIETIRDPLTHILRNAIDHGIEPPAVRLAAGKREIGLLHVSARQSGNSITIAVRDDGRGIDAAALVERAIAAGAVTEADARALDAHGRIDLIFESGISTAAAVTQVSGRGVGMDVVRANIERVGGAIRVASVMGSGTTIELDVPLTLSIVPALTLDAGGQRFAMPRSYIDEIVRRRADGVEFARLGDALLATVRGTRLPCLSLAAELGLPATSAPEDSTLVLVRLAGGDLFALAVDRVVDHDDLVIKPLAPAVMATGCFAGTTLMDDGLPVLLLDVAGIARRARLGSELARRRVSVSATAPEAAEATVQALLFMGLGGRRQAVPLSAVERVVQVPRSAIDVGGAAPQVALGDTLLPLAGLTGALPGGDQPLTVLRLTDGRGELAFAVRTVIETIDLPPAVAQATGTVLIGGAAADMLDLHAHFSALRSPRAAPDRPACRIPAGDPWARTFLAPLIESAGYRVVECGPAQVVIATDGAQPPGSGERTIVLREEPGSGPAGAIWRYDRAALLAALAGQERAA